MFPCAVLCAEMKLQRCAEMKQPVFMSVGVKRHLTENDLKFPAPQICIMEHRTKKHIMNSFVIWHKTKALPEQHQQGKEGLGETCHTLHRSLIPGDEEALHSPPRGTSKAISKVANANMRATP